MPLVSVVIPTHNRPELLAEALASVNAQTFTDYEIIVVANGEAPDMGKASRELAGRHGARYFALEKGSLPCARNFAVSMAAGEWIAFLDDDDSWLPKKLERQIAEARQTGADMIVTDYIESHPCGLEIVRRTRLGNGHWHAPPSAVLIRKLVFDAIGGFDPAFLRIEDSDLWRRISWRHSIHPVREALIRYRHGHPRLTQDFRATYLYELRHFQKMWRDTPVELRSQVPRWWSFVPQRLIGIYTPTWLRSIGCIIRPRYRFWLFRQWLQRSVGTSLPGLR